MPSPENSPRSELPRRFFTPPEEVLLGASFPPLEPGDTALTVVNQISRMRDTITFAELKRRAEYLSGETLKGEPAGLWTYEHLVRLDPTPLDTSFGRIFDVYRFAVNREYGAPHIITRTSFGCDAIQFEDIPILDRRALGMKHRDSPLVDWPIRVPPGGAITVTRRLLQEAKVQIRDAGEHQPAHLFEISQAVLGGVGVFEVLQGARPFSITMIDWRGIAPGELGRIGWLDCVEERGLGEHICATFHLASGVFVDRAVTIRNDGDVAFILAFVRPPQTRV